MLSATLIDKLIRNEAEVEDIPTSAVYIANYLHRSYSVVERDDILQEIFVWVYSHEEKIEQWRLEGKHGDNKIAKSMRHAGLKFCQEEKARILGYSVDDNYFYETALIKDTLAILWDSEAWENPPAPVEQARVKHRSVAEGNNYLATLSDVSRVVELLTDAERLLVQLYYRDGYSSKELASINDTSVAAIDSRLNRIVKKLQRLLGGERPIVRE
jgi:RNA polymerase sigma factor (sigma-70 family)